MKFKPVKLATNACSVAPQDMKKANQSLLAQVEKLEGLLSQSSEEKSKLEEKNAKLEEELKKKAKNNMDIIAETEKEIKKIENKGQNLQDEVKTNIESLVPNISEHQDIAQILEKISNDINNIDKKDFDINKSVQYLKEAMALSG